MKGFIYFIVISFGFNLFTNAQKSWVINNPFDQKCFIENKGQFKLTGENANEEILYGNWVNGINYYFSKDKFFISYPIKVERSEDETRALTNGREKEDEKELKYKTEYKSICFNFLNTNENYIISPNEKVPEYFNYNDINDQKKIKTITSNAFKSITYQNIYPNIDLIFQFIANEKGLKYYFEAKPGADISQIQMLVEGNSDDLSITENGDLKIPALIGDFIDKAPKANYINSQDPVEIKYNLEKNIISFDCKNYNPLQTIIIDPWVIDPNIAGLNRGFDVDYDNLGNVYVYGGNGLPYYQLKKYTSTGTLIWTFVNSDPNSNYHYGDFAVDRNSGSIYMINAIYSTTMVLKLNPTGSVVATLPGNLNLHEMWRITFNSNTKQAVIGGGGTIWNGYHACHLDTNLVSLNPVRITNGWCDDICSIAMDNFGNCYPWFVTPTADANVINTIKKVPIISLSPILYSITPNSNFTELSSTAYYFSFSPFYAGIGMNNTTVFNHNLYTYDSYRLKKWNTSTGDLVYGTSINLTSDTTKIFWSGVAVDSCENVYVGNKNVVSQYDCKLNHEFDYSCPDTVYDVQFGNNSIYVSGNGFLASIEPNPLNCPNEALTVSITYFGCSSVVTINNGGEPPYTIIWNTKPPVISSSYSYIEPDTIVVTVIDNSCPQKLFLYTVIPPLQAGLGTLLNNIKESNVFTPNDDNTNDLFYGFQLTSPTLSQDIKDASKEYQFTIFNRWGTVVYQTSDPTIGWNGQINNVDAVEGIYFWVMNIIPQCDPSKKYTYHNNVTLFR